MSGSLSQASRSESPRSSRSWNVLKIILALVLVGVVLSKTDPNELFALRARILTPWIVVVFFLYSLMTSLKALQYYFLLGRRLSYPHVLNIVVVQNAVSNFVATGAGIASYLMLFHLEHDMKLSRAALAFIMTKIGDLISIWLLLLVASLFQWAQVARFHGLIIVLLTVIGLAVVCFFITVFMRERFVSIARSLLDSLRLGRLRLVTNAMDTLQSLADQEHGSVFRLMGTGILLSLLYMAVTMAWLYASLRAFSLGIGVMPTAFVNTLIQVISYLPVQVFGGLGLTETSMLYFFGPFNLPQAELATVLIATRILFYLTNLVVLLYLPAYGVFRAHWSRPLT